MIKIDILAAIRKAAEGNGGKCPAMGKFIETTGIKESMWLGKYWARWSDALKEANVSPSVITRTYDSVYLMQKITELIKEIKKFPTGPEICLKRNSDNTYPRDTCFFSSFGGKRGLIKEILNYCSGKKELQEVSEICLKEFNRVYRQNEKKNEVSYVYLLSRAGKFQLFISDIFIFPPEIQKSVPGSAYHHHFSSRDAEVIMAIWQNDFINKHTGDNLYTLNEDEIKLFMEKIKNLILKKV